MYNYPFLDNIQEYYPSFAGYNSLIKGDIAKQQYAFANWWALSTCSPIDLGIDIGSARGVTSYCISVDLYGTGSIHPLYSAVNKVPYHSDIVTCMTKLSMFPSNTFPYICSNHSLEHMPSTNGDAGVVDVLRNEWLRILRKDGILSILIPDQAFMDVLAVDKDHKHAWSHIDFKDRILDPIRDLTDLVEYNTLNNNFSINAVLRKK